MSRLVFVSGVSCAGKTTVGRSLGKGMIVADIDDDGTPTAGAVAWLAWRSEELLLTCAEESADSGLPLVVTGIVWPHKVVESTALPRALRLVDSIHFIMLTVTKRDLRARLSGRLTSGRVGPYVDYNWSLQSRLRQQVEHQRNGMVIPPGTSVEAAAAVVREVAKG